MEKDTKKKRDDIEDSYRESPVIDNNLEYRTFNLHYYSFKCDSTSYPAQYSTPKILKLILLLFFISFESHYFFFKYDSTL